MGRERNSPTPALTQLRSNMLASNVEGMAFLRLNRHMVIEVCELDAANALAQKSAATQETSSMVVDLALEKSQVC